VTFAYAENVVCEVCADGACMVFQSVKIRAKAHPRTVIVPGRHVPCV